MTQDLKFGWRLWMKHPLSVGIAVVGLGVAIGVITTAFSIISATRLRPYGIDDPTTVVQVTSLREGNRYRASWAYSQFLQMRHSESLHGIEASVAEEVRVSRTRGEDLAVVTPIDFVSGGYMTLLGGRAHVGRSLEPYDDDPGAAPVVVIDHHTWVSRFLADPGVVGATVWINDTPATVVGVLRQDFSVPVYRQPRLWAPFAAFDDLIGVATTYTINGRIPLNRVGAPFGPAARTDVDVIARLNPDVAVTIAEAELTSLTGSKRGVRLFGASSPIDGPDAADSWLEVASLLGVVGLVLAVAFANAANLLLASTAARVNELGVRVALGATRWRLRRQMLAESLMLAAVASGLGLLLTNGLAPLASRLLVLDPGVDVTPDWRVLTFACGVAILCGLVSAVGPARQMSRDQASGVTNGFGAATLHSSGTSRLRSLFVSMQAAVSILLLACAALLARTAMHHAGNSAGFDSAHTLAVDVVTPQDNLDEQAFFTRARDHLRSLAGIDAVGLIDRRPFGYTREIVSGSIRDTFLIDMRRVDSGFFDAAGIRLLRGRTFTDADVTEGEPVAIISQSVARHAFGQNDPIGRQVREVAPDSRLEAAVIVGVVDDAMLNRLHTTAFGSVYRTLPQTQPAGPPALIVRTGNPEMFAPQVEQALRSLDAGVRPTAFVLQRHVDEFTRDQRLLASMAASAALLSLVLSTLGIFGVASFVVHRRLGEVSIRMTLGATVGDVSRMLVRDCLRPVIVGLGVGLVMALGAAKVFASLLPGISPFDPLSFVVASGLLACAALAAVIRPVQLTATVSPSNILRQG